ncbi:carboxypeptidase-like regulatory domain-containing protein [Actinomadura rupiterrae]|uniref:carboxypeptidase-like regulatory domain-containing protein n=1 Tax=Actinomadura rupiterrae TaxID=559627 RepID=UPI0020A40DAB|nr:carboxypeptidase-like regulatory domain-containing protein [Actinomadura rupiterrae]MCP2338026.1 hypothetical protein [Actinomadura rupiterrae]
MRRPVAVLTVALSLMAAPLAVPAHADDTVTVVADRPQQFVYADGGLWVSARVDGTADVRSLLVRFLRAGTDEAVASYPMDRQPSGLWRSHLKAMPPAGWMDAEFVVTGAAGHETSQKIANYAHVLRHTMLAGLPVSPVVVWKGQKDVRISGTAYERVASGGGLLVSGARVVLEQGTKQVAEATTSGDGRFAFTVPAPGRDGSSYTVDFPSQGDFQAYTRSVSLQLERHAARIRLDRPVVAQPVASGTRVKVSGSFEVQSAAGAWVPGGYGQKVRLDGVLVDVSEGRFSGTAVLSARTPLSAYFSGDDDYLPASAQLNLDVRDRTSLRAGNTPERIVARGGRVALEGFLERGVDGLSGQRVDLEFSADGKRWASIGHGTTGQYGYVKVSAVAAKDGRWRLRFPGEKNSLFPAVGPFRYVDVRNPVKVESFNASPEPVRKGKAITVRGRVLHQVGGKWKPVGRSTQMEVVFRSAKPGGQTAFAFGVGRDGWFTLKVPARADGTWFAHIPGNRDDVEFWSAGDYVDVR